MFVKLVFVAIIASLVSAKPSQKSPLLANFPSFPKIVGGTNAQPGK
jgi:hypothetical protein